MADITDQVLLDALNQVLLKRLNGDAYIEYTATTQRFRGETLEALMKLRTNLEARISATSGTAFGLAAPFWD
jgi:hypothetical protein